MEKLLLQAFNKLERREHLLRVLRDQMGLGRISKEVFKEREAEIMERYSFSLGEERAYDLYLRMMKGKRSSK
jgi:hypothetical protein